MSTKKNRRDLPPLLPLEYCSIERAARMLECETEDILHWFEVGAINLYLKVEILNAGVLVLSQAEYQKLIEMDRNSQHEGKHRGYKFGLSRFVLEENLSDAAFDENLYYLNVGALFGHWAVDFLDLEPALSTGKDTFSILGLYTQTDEIVSEAVSTEKKSMFFNVDFDQEIEFKFSQLQIVRRDLEKLHQTITTGEPLANVYNDPDIAAKFAKRDGQLSSNRPAEYNSKSRTAALVSMCELFKKTKKLEIKPDKLQAEINEELLKHGIAEIDGQRTILKAYLAVDK